MNNENHIYIAIDLKSFYASVECVERGLDPLTTNLVVADASRTEKTICLAVSPSLKAFGISGRARLFEVVQKVREVNTLRKSNAPNHVLSGSSVYAKQLERSPQLSLDYIVAPPQMAKYMAYSTQIYNIYLKYIAPEDIHVYSIDEVFIDVTHYLKTMNLSAKELAMKMIHDVFQTVGITATAGIGTNLYLCKIAMDIVAKHLPADEHGVRIAQLDEISYRKILWNHRPLTDFWRVGKGYAKKLQDNGLFTMGDVARCSIGETNEFYCEELLYKLFGVNAELLIDHAWGYEPCTIADVKAYKPTTHSISSGQVLQSPYNYNKARLIVREMTDLLVLDLVSKGLVTNQVVLTVGYDIENLNNSTIARQYHGPITIDMYGRRIPKQAHGTATFDCYTSSTKEIVNEVMGVYTRVVDDHLLIRRINLSANHVVDESTISKEDRFEQLDLFTDYEARQHKVKVEKAEQLREKKMQLAILEIKNKYGKNAILKGNNLEEGAMTIERNRQIGGHKE